MTKEFIGKSKNGVVVYIERTRSHAASHFAETPQLESLVKEIIAGCEVVGESLRIEKNFGRVVGVTDLVEIHPGDTVIYAKRIDRDTYSPFVKNRSPQPTSYVTIKLQMEDDKKYNLHTAYMGRLTPPIPGAKNETLESIRFWNTHALVRSTQVVVPGSETEWCPW
ncbi:MAG: hypothetical protein Q8R25_01030 [bacterium]|nr:hypothetical protein [bacterium]